MQMFLSAYNSSTESETSKTPHAFIVKLYSLLTADFCFEWHTLHLNRVTAGLTKTPSVSKCVYSSV